MPRVAGCWIPLAAVVTTTLASIWFPVDLASWGPLMFMASVVLFGLPHGAVDHVVMARLANVPLQSKRSAALVLLYLMLVLSTLAIWLAAPALVFAAFIAITWFHWGQGDAAHHGSAADPVLIASRGALPMLAPLVFHPEEYLLVADQFVRAAGHAGLTFSAPALQVAAALLLTAAVGAELRRKFSVEPLLLAVYFALVPPVLAIAVYFCLWHAPRHLIRLALELRGPRWPDLLWVLRASIPLTVAACVVVGIVFALLPTADYFAVYLAVIAALTVPHVVVVSWQDARTARSHRQ